MNTNLTQFKTILKEEKGGLEHYPYSVNKGRVFAYKTIFMTLAALFGGLSFHLYSSSLIWSVNLLFGNSLNLKLALCLLSAFIGTLALATSLAMTPEKEVAAGIVGTAKRRARRLLARRLAKLRHDRTFGIGKEPHDSGYWRELYSEAVEKIKEHQEEAALLIKRIRISRTLTDKEKESLYNQALCELKIKACREIERLV